MKPFVPVAGLIALALLGDMGGVPLVPAAAARAAPAASSIGGTWDLTWKNRRGETRSGSMVVEQRGNELVAHVYDRGGATATGWIAGSDFTLEGTRLALPFTVTGRVRRSRMTGSLTALGAFERRFTGVRRR